MDTLLVFTNLPNRESALALARSLVDAHLAACVNVLGGCTSIYRWQGAIETEEEVPVLIKTRAALYEAVEQAIRARHPYDVPEIIAVPVSHGLPAYIEWVAAETSGARRVIALAAPYEAESTWTRRPPDGFRSCCRSAARRRGRRSLQVVRQRSVGVRIPAARPRAFRVEAQRRDDTTAVVRFLAGARLLPVQDKLAFRLEDKSGSQGDQRQRCPPPSRSRIRSSARTDVYHEPFEAVVQARRRQRRRRR